MNANGIIYPVSLKVLISSKTEPNRLQLIYMDIRIKKYFLYISLDDIDISKQHVQRVRILRRNDEKGSYKVSDLYKLTNSIEQGLKVKSCIDCLLNF